MPAPDKYAKVGGARIHYIEAGNGPILTMHHGHSFTARIWEKVGTFDAAARSGYNVLSIDFPGFGDSERRRFESLGSFIYDFYNTLKIPKAVLMGSSMGGEAVIDFAVNHPEMVQALILVGAVGVSKYAERISALKDKPILLVWGKRDNISGSENYKIIMDRVDNAKLSVLDGGHACYLDSSEAFNKLITAFLKELHNDIKT
ncbi:MAG: alpha/beta fold hydrolase [Candidatus Micrarchaeia archaeon]